MPNADRLGDRHNMVYSGCSVSTAGGTAIVTPPACPPRWADRRPFGREDASPPAAQLEQMGKILGLVALAVCAVIFVMVGLLGRLSLRHDHDGGLPGGGRHPGGLPAIVTIVLAIGGAADGDQNAIIRRLPAVETLGAPR